MMNLALQAQCICLDSGDLRAWIHPVGAQLCGLRSSGGHELLWSGDAQWWGHVSPILFPVIGRCCDGLIRHEGRSYPMQAHGFAMHERFDLLHADQHSCGWTLNPSRQSREQFPFEFALQLRYRLEGRTALVAATVENTGDGILPFQLGFHPGLRWPIRGWHREGHVLAFEAEENQPARRRAPSGLLGPRDASLPWVDRQLSLNDALFDAGAHVLDHCSSRRVVYADALGPLLTLSWRGLPQLALWSLPGAPFVCVEPWSGLPDLDGQPVDLRQRPAVTLLQPGQVWSAELVLEADQSLCIGQSASAHGSPVVNSATPS